MTTVCVVSLAWGRFDVTRLVLKQRQALCAGLAPRGVRASSLIAADDDNLDIAREFGALTLERPNAPLGAKANAALRHAAGLADWVVWVGSDDWIHPDALDPLVEDGTHGGSAARVIVGERLSFVDLATGTLQRARQRPAYGAIPWILESRLLQGRRGLLRNDLERGMDGGLLRGIRRTLIPFRIEKHDSHHFRCVDFKTHENLSTYQAVVDVLGDDAPEPAGPALRGWFPADLVDKAEQLFGNP